MLHLEASRTLVFDVPRRAGFYFEALTDNNLNIGWSTCLGGDPRRRPHQS